MWLACVAGTWVCALDLFLNVGLFVGRMEKCLVGLCLSHLRFLAGLHGLCVGCEMRSCCCLGVRATPPSPYVLLHKRSSVGYSPLPATPAEMCARMHAASQDPRGPFSACLCCTAVPLRTLLSSPPTLLTSSTFLACWAMDNGGGEVLSLLFV